MRIQRLTRAPESGDRQTVDSLVLQERLGVVDDRRSAKDGSVSLLSGEAEEEISGLGGLCTERFMGNIVTQGLDYTQLDCGARLSIGICELEITRVGKRCYDDCAIRHAGETCPLPKSCAFARVLRGGEIRTREKIDRIGEQP